MAALQFSSSGASITTSLSVIHTQDLTDYKSCGVQIINSGATAFNQFDIQILAHDSGTWQSIILDTGGSLYAAGYDEPLKHPLLLVVPRSPYTLGAGLNSWIEMFTFGYKQIRWRASVAAGTTTAGTFGVLK